MSRATAGPTGATVAARGWLPRIHQWLGRAAGTDGHERHTLALIGKSALAATAAWVIAHDMMHAQSPAFAPFSAVLIMRVTIYRSLLQTLRYIAAVSAGVAVQSVLGFLAGPGLLTFAMVTVAAMTIGRWRHLGSQGSQVVTAAFFAFSTYISATSDLERLADLGQIILLVLVGCAAGALVNIVVLPPLRYRSAEHGIQALGHSLCDLISDIYPVLQRMESADDRADDWRRRASNLGHLVTQAQSSIQLAHESTYYNPRRLLRGAAGRSSFSGYQALVDALERVTYQVGSMTRSLHQWRIDDDRAGHGEFFHRYGDFLGSFAHVTYLFSQLDEDRLTDQAPELCKAAKDARALHARLAEHADWSGLPLTDPSRPYGILLVEATRLMDEAQHSCDVFQHGVDHAEGDSIATAQ